MKRRTGNANRADVGPCRNGIWPDGLPEIHVAWVRATSSAISAPELPTPTTRTFPSCSCPGFLYKNECSCTTLPSSSPANAGMLGVWFAPVATTTLSASNRRSPDRATNRFPSRVSESTRTPVRTGMPKRFA